MPYRLVEWLGGHEVHVRKQRFDSFWDVMVDDPKGVNCLLTLHKDLVVEVKPPSIDDQVDLPLYITDGDGDSFAIEARDGGPGAFVSAARLGVHLDPEECRDAARALWKLGNGSAS